MFGLVNELDVADLALLVIGSIPNINKTVHFVEKFDHRLVILQLILVLVAIAVVPDHLDASLRRDLDRKKHSHLEIGVQVEMIVSEYVLAQGGGKPAVGVATCKPDVVKHDESSMSFPSNLRFRDLLSKALRNFFTQWDERSRALRFGLGRPGTARSAGRRWPRRRTWLFLTAFLLLQGQSLHEILKLVVRKLGYVSRHQ